MRSGAAAGMRRYVHSPRAHADMSGIWDYTAEHWGVDQADRYIRQIVTTCADSRRWPKAKAQHR
jgi:plasmid stabilization system protein ParE